MRRVLFLIAVLVILISCAVPAMALGNGSGTILYTPVIFDELYSNLDGGPYEWMFNTTNYSSDYTVEFNLGATPSNPTIATVEGYSRNHNGALEGEVTIAGKDFTLASYQHILRVSDCDAYYIGLNNDARFKSLRIYGNYYVVDRDAQGEVRLISKNFDYKHEFGSTIKTTFSLGEELRLALSDKVGFDETAMMFNQLFIDLAVEVNGYSTPRISVYCPRSSLSTYVYAVNGWMNKELSKFVTTPQAPVVGNFEIGTFLGDSVAAFMNTSITENFTFGHIFGICLTLGVLFFALKLLV